MKTRIYTTLFSGLLFAALGLTSCEDIWNHCVDGNGHRSNVTRTMGSFNEVVVNGEFEVQIDTGRASSVFIDGDENLLDLVVTHVSGNQLFIETEDHTCLQPTHPIVVTVTTSELRGIHLNGSGKVNCSGLQTDELSLYLDGSGEVTCHETKAFAVFMVIQGSGYIQCSMATENLTANLEGSGEIGLNGVAINAEYNISGSGRIQGGEMITDTCSCNISGSGRIDTRVNNLLNVTITGSGMVYYFGNPVVESYISGSGKVIHQ
jgi:hypothetical protein